MTGRQSNNSIRPKACVPPTAVVYTREHSPLHITTGTATAGTFSLQAIALTVILRVTPLGHGATGCGVATCQTQAQWSLYVPPGVTLAILRFAHTVCLCFKWISEQTAIISLYSIN